MQMYVDEDARANANARNMKIASIFFLFVFSICVSVCDVGCQSLIVECKISPWFHFTCRFCHLINSNGATTTQSENVECRKCEKFKSEKSRRIKWTGRPEWGLLKWAIIIITILNCFHFFLQYREPWIRMIMKRSEKGLKAFPNYFFRFFLKARCDDDGVKRKS